MGEQLNAIRTAGGRWKERGVLTLKINDGTTDADVHIHHYEAVGLTEGWTDKDLQLGFHRNLKQELPSPGMNDGLAQFTIIHGKSSGRHFYGTFGLRRASPIGVRSAWDELKDQGNSSGSTLQINCTY